MDYVECHAWPADVSFDGGTLDCGNGLLLLIRKHIDPLRSGQLLEIRSQESSVEEDLPAWCRLTKNELLSCTRQGSERSFLVSKGPFGGRSSEDVARAVSPSTGTRVAMPLPRAAPPVVIPDCLPAVPEAPALP